MLNPWLDNPPKAVPYRARLPCFEREEKKRRKKEKKKENARPAS